MKSLALLAFGFPGNSLHSGFILNNGSGVKLRMRMSGKCPGAAICVVTKAAPNFAGCFTLQGAGSRTWLSLLCELPEHLS